MVENILWPDPEQGERIVQRYKEMARDARQQYNEIARDVAENGPRKVKIPPRAPGGHNFWAKPGAIPITEEEYVAMYRTQHVDYKAPDDVVVGMTITMPSGVTYVVSLPPRRVEEEPIPF